MQQRSTKHGSLNVGVIVALGVLAIAGFAGAVMFQRSSSADIAAAPAEIIQGSSFNQPAQAAVAATPAAIAAPEAPSPAKEPTEASPAKPASAADIPADISRIPSATPVPRLEVASVAGGSPPPPPASPEPADTSGYKELNWQVLAGYNYIEPVPREGAKPEEIEAERKKNQIPADVMALSGSKAMVEGWMVPMQVDDNGGVKTFVLVKTQPQCCFGDTQKMNEWIDVTMPEGKTAEFNVDRPIKVYGQMEAGEKVEDGFVLSIYRMKADKVSG